MLVKNHSKLYFLSHGEAVEYEVCNAFVLYWCCNSLICNVKVELCISNNILHIFGYHFVQTIFGHR